MHKSDDPLGFFFFFCKLQSIFIENTYSMKCIERGPFTVGFVSVRTKFIFSKRFTDC